MKLRDALVEDPDLTAARRNQKVMAAAIRPSARTYTGGPTTGDGDRCPLDPAHGKMYVFGGRQWCAYQTHDGSPGADGVSPTRSFWPLYGLTEAASEYRRMKGPQGEAASDLPEIELDLPDLNIELEL